MKKSTVVSIISIVGAVALTAIGLTLIILHQMGADGRLANWPNNSLMLFIAYGCIIGPIVVLTAVGLLRAGSNKSDDLYAQEVRTERAKKKALQETSFNNSEAMADLLEARPDLIIKAKTDLMASELIESLSLDKK